MTQLNGTALGFEERLVAYAEPFHGDFRRRDQARWISVYLQGLLLDGDRKTVETLARRVQLPEDVAVEDAAQALQNFINQSPWEERRLWQRYWRQMAEWLGRPDGVFLIDDVTFPKQGEHSVGVQRQYSSAAGKKINCQLAVAVHYVSAAGHCPLVLRLYLPRGWLRSPGRLDLAAVPPEYRLPRARGEIALELLDAVRLEGVPGTGVVAGAGYGTSPEFRAGLARRGLTYLAEVADDVAVLPPDGGEAPRTVKQAAELALPGDGLRDGRFAWQRVRARAPGEPPEELGLLVEETRDGRRHFALGNLPDEAACADAVRFWRRREAAAAILEEMRSRLGLDQFEGRSWRGFHHHACLVMLGYGFLLSRQLKLAY